MTAELLWKGGGGGGGLTSDSKCEWMGVLKTFSSVTLLQFTKSASPPPLRGRFYFYVHFTEMVACRRTINIRNIRAIYGYLWLSMVSEG